jgi:hypothetical protein
MKIRNAVKTCALETFIQDFKNKWHKHVSIMYFSRLTEEVKNYQQKKEILVNQEDDGRIFCETRIHRSR